MGRRSLTVDLRQTWSTHTIASYRGCTLEKQHVHAQDFLSALISELGLTERQKCADAGGQRGFLPHGFLNSSTVKRWGPMVTDEEKERQK